MCRACNYYIGLCTLHVRRSHATSLVRGGSSVWDAARGDSEEKFDRTPRGRGSWHPRMHDDRYSYSSIHKEQLGAFGEELCCRWPIALRTDGAKRTNLLVCNQAGGAHAIHPQEWPLYPVRREVAGWRNRAGRDTGRLVIGHGHGHGSLPLHHPPPRSICMYFYHMYSIHIQYERYIEGVS